MDAAQYGIVIDGSCVEPLTIMARMFLSPGVSECRGCRAVSGSVGPVSGRCRLTPVSEVSGSVGAGVGPVSDRCRTGVGAP